MSTNTSHYNLEKPAISDGYDVTVQNDNMDKIDAALWALPKTRAGIANYSGLKGGGWADRVTVPITFSSPMPGTTYDVFAVVAGAYGDFPFIKCTPDGSANTVNGTSIILVNSSGNSTAVSGSIYWFAVMRH